MVQLKSKEIRRFGKEERNSRLKELQLELIKSKTSASKSGSAKIKQIRRTIAKIITVNKSDKEALNK